MRGARAVLEWRSGGPYEGSKGWHVARIRKIRLSNGIFLLKFSTQYELAATFLRFQEHAESSRFSGRTFSLEQFMDWYAGKFGNFTYFQDWAGFNVPSTALEPFRAGAFDPLLEKERRFLKLFARERRPFYVIGVGETHSRSDLAHEIAHALFFTSPEYRDAVLAGMRGYDTASLRRALSRMGYSRGVLMDEVHAYLVAGAEGVAGPAVGRLAALRRALQSIFAEHSRALLARASRELRTARSRKPPRRPARRKAPR